MDCYQFGGFPYYPGSLAVAASSQDARAWHVYASPTHVASYYANGASRRAPACRGSLVVMADAAGGTLYEAKPDS